MKLRYFVADAAGPREVTSREYHERLYTQDQLRPMYTPAFTPGCQCGCWSRIRVAVRPDVGLMVTILPRLTWWRWLWSLFARATRRPPRAWVR